MVLARHPETFYADCPDLATLSGVSFLQGDVRDFDFPKISFDAIIHAATPAVTTIDDAQMRSIILDGTRRVLAFARECGCARFLFTSSGAVYGPQTAPVGEETPCHPVTAYGIAKREAELLCLASGIETLIARCFAFTGPYLNRKIHFAIGNFIQNVLEGKPIEIQGDGTPYRSYLYADDLVEWLQTILLRGRPGEIDHVGSDEALTIAELAETVRDALERPDLPIHIARPPEGRPASWYVPETSRTRTRLGVTARVTLQDAIRLSAGM